MSWNKRPQGGTAPPTGAERQPYIAPQAQPFGNQENMFPNYQGGAPGTLQQQQQFWQMPAQQQQQQPPQQPQQPPQQQPLYNQQYGQGYQQQDYPTNANQFYSQPNTYNNMNYANQGYNNTSQVRYPQQNYYQNQGQESQGQQQQFSQPKQNVDRWEDNWDWGWGDDSSKQAQKPPQNIAQQPPPTQQPVYNNANVIEESFAATDGNCWNWAMDDKKGIKEPTHDSATLPISNPIQENNTLSDSTELTPASTNNVPTQPADNIRTLNDRDAVQERLPNLALGKRFHLENLTPQWSIESQMSQESSDGLHTQSEGTYRSDNQSRNSSKSSPGPNTDNSNFNYSQPGLDEGFAQNSEWSRPSDDTLADNTQSSSRRESHDELSSSMQEMSLANHEKPLTDNLHLPHECASRYIQEPVLVSQPPPAASPATYPAPLAATAVPPMTSAMPPPPPVLSAPPPSTTPSLVAVPPSLSSGVVPPSSSVLPPPPSSTMPPPPSSTMPHPSSSAIPPPNFAPSSTSNPFKHAGPFSHKSLPKGSPSTPSLQTFPTQIGNTNLASPAAVSKVSQNSRVPLGFEANLETTPDNSERPDQPQVSAFRPTPVTHQLPDNMEVAPRNDRNEYLQTAHLSSSDFGENTDFSRGVPPGLRRMVVGQQESEYSQNLNNSGDEPPPGLARMVPGQQTEVDNSYNQPSDNYLDRHIDGQTTDNSSRPYRQADGQQTPDNYTQSNPSRVNERRPIGLDRMVPGEPSNDEYSQYQGPTYAGANEHRVVTGVDHDFPIPTDAGPPDVREQNVDGSDYTEQSSRNPPRNVIGARESSTDASPDFTAQAEHPEQMREVTMEGENLQDLSIISSTDLTFSRFSEPVLDAANVTHTDDRKTDLSDSIDHQVSSSRRQSLNRVNTSGEDSERDRAFKASPRRDRDKHKSTRDRDRDRDRERDRDRDREKDGRYSRGDRKYDPDRRSVRDDRRAEKDKRDREGYRDRRDRDESPDTRRQRRSTRSHRAYQPEDIDYYSDRERERRRHREGSYTSSKPPRPEDKDRRYDERDRSKRYNTIERERRYDDDRESRRRSDRYRERERYERAYRDIDPTRKYGNLRTQREKDERRGEFSSPSRPDSRGEATATDDDGTESRRRDRRSRRTADSFYDEYGAYADPYLAQRQQYQYYEQLRLTNPAAYMAIFMQSKQLLAGHAPQHAHDYRNPLQPASLYGDEFSSLGYEQRQERASVHSGRSSTTPLKGNETDLTTDMSLNLHLEESTVRSERMTPFRYSTAHIKGSISSRDVVVVRPSYPVDGVPATVHVVSLASALQHQPLAADLAAFPGPLVKGVTHKKSVIDYCGVRIRNARTEGARDVTGYVLVWDLLALMLRQNGVVVGSDIAELLMKNTREYEFKPAGSRTHNESRRGSSESCERGEGREDERSSSPEQPSLSVSENINQESSTASSDAALDKLRELLTYGNRQEALECAMSSSLWGHALALAAHGDRRTRAAVTARFLAALQRTDPLHTLYAALGAATPPAATCVADDRWGDWRPHAAIILSNPSSKPEQDRRTLTQMGDSLNSRGLLYSAQFCYLSAGVQFSRHPMAPLPPCPPEGGGGSVGPPRLALLLADSRATTLHQLATNRALFATEVYEYALSLTQDDFVITELQAYKLVVACRLVDCGLYERALAYTEAAARAVTRNPALYSPALVLRLAELADRLKYHDPALQEDPPLLEEPDSEEPSPRHHQQWLDDVKNVAHMLTAQASAQPSPSHHEYFAPPQHPNHPPQPPQPPQQYAWGDQHQAPEYQQVQEPVPTYTQPPVEDKTDYPAQYYSHQPQHSPQQQQQQAPPDEQHQYGQYEEWPRPEEQHRQYADPYWQGETPYGGYGERAAALELEQGPPASGLRRRLRPTRRAEPATPRAPAPRPAPLSDLDVQIAHSPGPAPPPSYGRARPAPRLICSTVDSWARRGVVREGAYKPLVFGGTYPIDEPASPEERPPDREEQRRRLRRTVEQSLDEFEAMLARRRARLVATFAVDEPVARGAPPLLAPERDAKYYVAGPKTFDIDEPVSFI